MDGLDRHVALLVTEHHGAEHDFFAQLLGFRFDHQHGGFGAGHDQVHLRALARGLARVQHVFAIDVTHACSANRAGERDAGNRQRSAGRDHGSDVGVDFRVQRQRVDHDVDFIEKAFREQRADRAVDQAAGQGFVFAGFGFALEEAAGNLASGIGLFDVVDGQREKVLTGLGGLGRDHGRQHHGVIDVDDHGARGLARDFAGFHDDGLVAPLEGLGDFVEQAHVNSSVNRAHGLRLGPGNTGSQNTMPFQKISTVSVKAFWNDTARIRSAVFAGVATMRREPNPSAKRLS